MKKKVFRKKTAKFKKSLVIFQAKFCSWIILVIRVYKYIRLQQQRILFPDLPRHVYSTPIQVPSPLQSRWSWFFIELKPGKHVKLTSAPYRWVSVSEKSLVWINDFLWSQFQSLKEFYNFVLAQCFTMKISFKINVASAVGRGLLLFFFFIHSLLLKHYSDGVKMICYLLLVHYFYWNYLFSWLVKQKWVGQPKPG